MSLAKLDFTILKKNILFQFAMDYCQDKTEQHQKTKNGTSRSTFTKCRTHLTWKMHITLWYEQVPCRYAIFA